MHIKRFLIILILLTAWGLPAAMPGPVFGQSLLSLAPEGWEPPEEDDDRPGAPLHNSLTLSDLFEQIDEGTGGSEPYRFLLERFPQVLKELRNMGENPTQLEKKILIYLLRSGEIHASPANQENLAHLFTEKFPNDSKYPIAFFYLLQAQFRQGKALADSFFFDEHGLESFPPWMRTRYLRMRAQGSFRNGDAQNAAGFLIQEYADDEGLKETTREEIFDALGKIESLTALNEFLETHENTSWLSDNMTFTKIQVMINQGLTTQALLAVENLAQESTNPREVKFIHWARSEIRSRATTSKYRIGVLLPLGSSSRTLRELASQTLDGLRIAMALKKRQKKDKWKLARFVSADISPQMDFPSPKDAPGFELVVRDTANNTQQTQQMVEKMVREDRVIGIIGPLARAESEAATARAEELGVPLISLSLTAALAPNARFMFRHSKSQEEEVRDLVRFAMEYKNAKRFALLFPDNGYGRSISQIFWKEVEKRGGKVVAAGAYQPSKAKPSWRGVGLKALFENFTGMDRLISKEEAKLIEKNGDSNPDPIVDFDALFIPISPDGDQDLRLIAPYPITVNAENVIVLGSRFWNSDEVIVSSGGKLDGSVFVDALDRNSRLKSGREFRINHRIMFGHRSNYTLPTYYTALGYDTLNLLFHEIAQLEKPVRPLLARKLASMKPYSGVTGLTAFTQNGEAVKESIFFRMEKSFIRRIQP